MAKRRERVMHYVDLGTSIEEVCEKLEDEGFGPVNETQIVRDLKAIEADWRERALRGLDLHKAEHYSRLSGLFIKASQAYEDAEKSHDKRAWMDRQIALLKEIAKLNGLYAPQQQAMVGPDGGPVEITISMRDEGRRYNRAGDLVVDAESRVIEDGG